MGVVIYKDSLNPGSQYEAERQTDVDAGIGFISIIDVHVDVGVNIVNQTSRFGVKKS